MIKKSKCYLMSWVTNISTLKLRYYVREEFIVQSDSKVILWTGCLWIALVHLAANSSWPAKLKVAPM